MLYRAAGWGIELTQCHDYRHEVPVQLAYDALLDCWVNVDILVALWCSCALDMGKFFSLLNVGHDEGVESE
jgi:hypothetical protein